MPQHQYPSDATRATPPVGEVNRSTTPSTNTGPVQITVSQEHQPTSPPELTAPRTTSDVPSANTCGGREAGIDGRERETETPCEGWEGVYGRCAGGARRRERCRLSVWSPFPRVYATCIPSPKPNDRKHEKTPTRLHVSPPKKKGILVFS